MLGSGESSDLLEDEQPAAKVLQWPAPALLEGVKSRKRAVFSVESAKIVVGDGVSRISSVRLALESRVLASGAAGRALVEVLLGEQKLAAGQAKRHDAFRVARLGPNYIDSDQVVGEVIAEIAASAATAALQDRPQALVIDASRETLQQEAWALVLRHILESPEVRSFRGAVVVCADEETPLIKSICSERWTGADGWVWQEQLAGDDLEIWEDVLGGKPNYGQSSPSSDIVAELLKEVNEVGDKYFSEDVIEKSKRLGWTLSLLVEPCTDGPARLCGFLCHRLPTSKKNDLHIARLAVPEAQHKGGHGHRLMHWILRKAANMPNSECAWVSLSALDTALPFYEKFGFCDMTCDDLEDPDHFQTWMEMPNHSIVPDQVMSDDEE